MILMLILEIFPDLYKSNDSFMKSQENHSIRWYDTV